MWASGGLAVNLLLESGADAHARSSKGRSALMFASSRGDIEAIERLACVPDMDVNAQDKQGNTAHALAMAAGYEDACDLLVELGAEPTARPPPRLMLTTEALHEAAKTGD